MNWYKRAQLGWEYVGNCTNLFDPDTGECCVGIFRDVSEFAYKDENAIEISKDDFHSLVPLSDFPHGLKEKIYPKRGRYPNLKYFFYDGNILVLYEGNDDIHYFWSKYKGASQA